MKLDLDRQEHGRSQLEISGNLELGLADGRTGRADLAGVLTVDNVASRFLLNGALRAEGLAECGRCLREFSLVWKVPVEIMVLRDVDSDEGEGDSLVLHQKSGEADLSDPLRECAVLAFPLAPLCDQECKGLCPSCGIDRNNGSCECAEEDYDPRWEGLP